MSQRKVAVKVYEKSKLETSSQRRSNLVQEILNLDRLSHPRVVKLLDWAEDVNHIYLILEFVEGIPLNKYIQRWGSKNFKEDEAKYLFKQILDGVAYCHEKMIAHRDLKLENILITSTEYSDNNQTLIKIIDFGFSFDFSEIKLTSNYCGTPSYMAPEIIKRLSFDPSLTDIWAMGVILYYFFTGVFPFRG